MENLLKLLKAEGAHTRAEQPQEVRAGDSIDVVGDDNIDRIISGNFVEREALSSVLPTSPAGKDRHAQILELNSHLLSHELLPQLLWLAGWRC